MRKIIFFLFLLTSLKGFCTRYYFNSATSGLHHGSDSATNIQAQDSTTPWRSIQKLNAIFSTLVPGDSVLLRRGQTFYTTTGIVINQSGNASQQITIAAYGTGKLPIVTSLLPLTFFNQGTNLWRSNQTISNTYLNCVVVIDSMYQMGRWPKLSNDSGGYNSVRSFNSTLITLSNSNGQLSGIPAIYSGCEVVYRAGKFWIQRERITSYNVPNHQITYVLHVASNGNVDKQPQTGYGCFVQNDSNTSTPQDGGIPKSQRRIGP